MASLVTTTVAGTLAVKLDAGLTVERTSVDSRFRMFNTGGEWILASTFGSTGAYDPIKFQTSDVTRLTIAANGAATFSGHVLPGANGTYNLGGSGNYWASCFFENTAINGTLSCGGLTASTGTFTGAIAGIAANFTKTSSDAYTPTAYNNDPILTLLSPNAATEYSGIRFSNATGNYEKFLGSVQTGGATADIVFQGYDRAVTSYKEYFRIKEDGKVGIGTSAPGAKLHVYGGNIRISSTDDKPQLEFFETAAARWVIGHSTAPNNYFAISEGSDVAASERLVIAPTTGNVGIENTAPKAKLHVGTSPLVASDISTTAVFAADVAGTAYPLTLSNTNAATVNDAVRMSFSFWNSWSATAFVEAKIDSTTTAYTSLVFGTYGPSSLQERMRVLGNGNVGIGTNAPATTLDVNGIITSRDLIKIGAAGIHGQITFLSDRLILNGASGKALSLGTNGAWDKLFMDTAGKVGIGTTAPAYLFDVNGAARIVDGISSPAFWFRPNAFSVHCWQPKGGWFHNQTNVHTGAIRIKLPPMHDAMVTFWVDVYDYADNESFSAYISGYPYQGTTWSHTSAVIIGGVARNFTVRFGDNNTAGASAEYYVYIGETNQSWNHIQVVVRDVFCGYHVYANEWDGGDAGWGVSFATSFANIAKTQSNTLPYGDYNKLINVPSGSDVTGSGTDNYVPRWNGTTALQNSSIYADDNGNVGVGNAVPGNFKLNVSGAVYASGSVVIANGTSYFGALNSAGAAQQLLALNASNQLLLGSSGIANAGYPARVLAKYITFEPAGTLGAPVETMRVTNASFNSVGSVGIGTTAPSSSLHVNSEISCGTNDDNRSMFGYELANSRFYIGTRQAGTNYFDTVTVKTGKVGIGTTTFLSNSLLEIYKASGNLHLRMIAADNASCSIAFRNATGNEVYCGMFGDQTGGINKFGIYNAGLRMVVDNAGKVGIATATPNYKLEVRGTDNNQRLGIQPNTATAKRMHLAYNSYLSSNTNWYGSYAGSTGMITFYEEGVYQTNVGGIGFNIDRIASDNTVVGVNPAPKMIITTDSKVGIGTAAPATPLHVWSTSYPQFRVSYNSSLYFTLDHAATLNVYGNDWYVRLNGSEKFRIKQDGKVGIGTNNPLNLLTLRQAAGANIRFENATTGRYFIVGEGVGANDKFSFRGNSYRSTDTLTVDFANNRVGIGTISPVSPLHVKGTSDTNIISIGVGHADGSVRSHWGYDSSGATMGFIVGSAYANDSAKFQIRMRGTASSDAKVTVLGGGEFGIGTSAPTSKLTIDDPSAQMAINSASCAIMIRAATALNQYSNIGFNYSGGAHEPQCTIGIQQKQWASYTYADLVFATRNVTTNTAPTERMRIEHDGKVGIGTTNPGYALDIRQAAGDVFVQSNTGTNRAGFQTANNGGTSYFYRDSSSGTAVFSGSSVYATVVGGTGARSLHLGTYGTVKVTVTSDGNVGIGEAAPGAKLTVAGNAIITSSNPLYMGGNATAIGSWVSRQYATGSNHYLGCNGFQVNNIGYVSPATTFLHIYSTGQAIFRSIVNNHNYHYIDTTSGGYNPILGFLEAGTRRAYINYVSADNYLSITTEESGSDIALMPLAGSVGIGTTNPGQKLHVNGNILVNAQILTPSGSNLQLNPNTGLVTVGGALTTTGNITGGGTAIFTGDMTIADDLYLKATNAWIIAGSVAGGALTGGTLRIQNFGELEVDGVLDINGTGTSTFAGALTTAGRITLSNDGSNNGLFMNSWQMFDNASEQWGTAGDLVFYHGGSRLVIGDTGNVGIGTTAPTSYSASTKVLHVLGTNAELKVESNNGGGWAFSHYKTPGASWLVGSDDSDIFRISNVSSLSDARLTILGDGKVGIGSATPIRQLDVLGAVAGQYSAAFINTSTTGHGVYIKGGPNHVSYMSLAVERQDGSINFVARGDGNFGIGTNAPNESSFSGDCRVLSVQGSAANGFGALELITPDVTSTNRLGEIRFVNLDGTSSTPAAYAGIRSIRDGADNKANLSFWTGETSGGISQRVTITSGGNVGIGTAANLNSILNVYGGTSSGPTSIITCMSANASVGGGAGIFFKSSNNHSLNRYGAQVSAIRNSSDNGSADLVFNLEKTDGSGLAERMRILGNGKVGIGTTNPGTTLEVNGRAMVGISPNDNNGNSDFSVGVGGSGSTIALYSGHIFMGGVDTMNWYFKLSYSGGSSRLYSWANDIYISAGWNGTSASHDVVLSAATSNNTPSEYLRCDGSTGKVYFSKPAYFGAAVYDKNNSYGTSGQVLSTTGSGGVDWVTPSGGGGDTVSITTSADDILSVSSGAISGVDAGSSDKIVFWDNSQSKLTYLAASTGLYTNGTNLKVTSAVLMSIQDTNYNYCTPSSNTAGFYQGGSITVVASGNGVTFSDSTSSDYRLKSNISTFNSEAWTKVKSVNLRRFDFNESLIDPNSSAIIDRVGFIAHELAEAGIEGAVEGSKDEVDSDGNPVYQKVCLVKLVPVMWGALKEAITKIETLETKVQTLENS